jgi:hypothetical protein
MTFRKRFLPLLACSAVLACAADLSTAHTVYVLSMSRGIDQYLANRLTNAHLLQVVTDPKLADVVFTDHIGQAFQLQLESLLAPPPKDEDTAADDAKGDKDANDAKEAKDTKGAKDGKEAKDSKDAGDAKEAKDAKEPKDADAGTARSMFSKPVNTLTNPALTSSFGRNKGTFFLVDAKSHEVLWSIYAPPKSFTGKELDRTALDIVNRLKKDLGKK